MKKDYLQPIIEIEYYLDVILCAQNDGWESYGDAGQWGEDDENPIIPPFPG